MSNRDRILLIVSISILLSTSVVAQTVIMPAAAESTETTAQSIPACNGDLGDVRSLQNLTYGGEDDDNVFDVAKNGNQIYLAGSTKSYNEEPELRQETNYDGWVVALYPNRTERWNESYGDDSGHSGYAITNASNDGALLVGTANEPDSNEKDGWAVRIGSNGTEIWNQTFGEANKYDRLHDAAPAPGGGFYLVGETISVADNRFESEHRDAWLLKVNETGNLISERVIGGYNQTYGKEDSLTGIQKTTNGYILSGQTESLTPKTYSAVWLLGLDINGNEVWNHTYANGLERNVNDIYYRNSGEVIVVGRSDEYEQEGGWLASLSTDGELRWERTYGGSVDRFESLVNVDERGYLIAGSTWTCSEEDSYADYSLTKIRPNTSVKWASQYGDLQADQVYGAVSPHFGRLWLIGSTSSFGDNAWVVNIPIDPSVPSVNSSYRPPQDRDLDGLFEDVNGDAIVNRSDVGVFFANHKSNTVQTHTRAFDYNNDGSVDIVDTQALYFHEVEEGEGERRSASENTNLTVSPEVSNMTTGTSTAVELVAYPTSGGVGAYNISVSLNTSVASITDISLNGDPGESATSVQDIADNSTVHIRTALANTSDTGAVKIGTLTVTGQATGLTHVNITVDALGNETGAPYTVTSTENATIEVESSSEDTTFHPSDYDTTGDGTVSGDLQGVLQAVADYNTADIGLSQVLQVIAGYNSVTSTLND